MSRDDLHFRLRIPPELKSQIEAAAADNRRSMTAEIIERLERTFVAPTQTDEFVPLLVRSLVAFFADQYPEQTGKEISKRIKVRDRARPEHSTDESDT